MGGGRDVVQGEEKMEKVIAPAKPEAQAVIQLVVDGGFI